MRGRDAHDADRAGIRGAPDWRIGVWRAFLRAHAGCCAELERGTGREAGLPLAWYDVLLQLAEAPERRLRMAELADSVLLSRSGLTRLVDRLQAEGLVRRERSTRRRARHVHRAHRRGLRRGCGRRRRRTSPASSSTGSRTSTTTSWRARRAARSPRRSGPTGMSRLPRRRTVARVGRPRLARRRCRRRRLRLRVRRGLGRGRAVGAAVLPAVAARVHRRHAVRGGRRGRRRRHARGRR